jgi:hypothetical protein
VIKLKGEWLIIDDNGQECYIRTSAINEIVVGSPVDGAHLVELKTADSAAEFSVTPAALSAVMDALTEKPKPESKWFYGYSPNSLSKIALPDGSIVVTERVAWASLVGFGGIVRWELRIGFENAYAMTFDVKGDLLWSRTFYGHAKDWNYSVDIKTAIAPALAYIRESLPDFPDVPAREP